MKNKPLGQVGFAIAQAATNCRDHAKALIQASTEADRVEHEIYIFFEFIYFFMHLTMHRAAAVLSGARLESLQDLLGITIPRAAIDSYFYHWPEERKQNMAGEFVERLNEREEEYSGAADFETPLEGVERSAARLQVVLGTLARNVLSVASDDENDVREILRISQFTLAEWTKMRLDGLLARVAEFK